MRILSQINDVLELQLIAIKEEDEKVNRGDLKEVFFTQISNLTFVGFIAKIQCFGEMFIDDVRRVAIIMSDNDAGGW